MTTCILDLILVLRYKWWNYRLQFKINRLSDETKLFIILLKLAQLVQLDLALIYLLTPAIIVDLLYTDFNKKLAPSKRIYIFECVVELNTNQSKKYECVMEFPLIHFNVLILGLLHWRI